MRVETLISRLQSTSLVELLEHTISYRTTLDDLNCTWTYFASMSLICELGLVSDCGVDILKIDVVV